MSHLMLWRLLPACWPRERKGSRTLTTIPETDYTSAYTTELELEVAHLTEENAKLKKQQQLLCSAAAAQPPKKQTLHRSSTAPF
ncbi:hypothetical protein F0562_003966 [Nyssa sinensis]|uniref:Uncharacterized protein n=1 Tax=Nyssa sinensis TaxID=561372 RepID=A0A5J5C0S8_9ASTE|nr:hypothetical protein F0562_003966 [Nyssa sinensis]